VEDGEAGTRPLPGAECDDPLMSIVAVPAELTACTGGGRPLGGRLSRRVELAGDGPALSPDVAVVTLRPGCCNLAGSPVYACTLTGRHTIMPGAAC
jgi:hypothetical protein